MHDEKSAPLPKAEVDRLRALVGVSQNELARRIHTDPAHLLRVLRGERVSGPVWKRLRRYFQRQGVLAPPATAGPAGRRSA